MTNNISRNRNDASDIERVVMRRVRRIHVLGYVFNGFTASCLLLLLALWGVGREVWVARVFENMPRSGDPAAVLHFYLSAFLNTRFIVQALSLAVLAATIWLARELGKLLGSVLVPAHTNLRQGA